MDGRLVCIKRRVDVHIADWQTIKKKTRREEEYWALHEFNAERYSDYDPIFLWLLLFYTSFIGGCSRNTFARPKIHLEIQLMMLIDFPQEEVHSRQMRWMRNSDNTIKSRWNIHRSTQGTRTSLFIHLNPFIHPSIHPSIRCPRESGYVMLCAWRRWGNPISPSHCRD